MPTLVVQSVTSAHQLSGALSPGQANEFGNYDADSGTLDVGDGDEAARLVDRYNNVSFAEAVSKTTSDDTYERRNVEPPYGEDGFDAGDFVDRTPVADVAEDIGSGEFDDHLAEIAEAEEQGRDRKTVKEAIEERR